MTEGIADRVRHVESRILLIRGEKVIIDSDLALLSGVKPKCFNEQVKRNQARSQATSPSD